MARHARVVVMSNKAAYLSTTPFNGPVIDHHMPRVIERLDADDNSNFKF